MRCLYVVSSPVGPEYLQPFIWIREELYARGYNLSYPRIFEEWPKDGIHDGVFEKADALICDVPLCTEETFKCGMPVIVFDRMDGAELSRRQWVRPSLGVLKMYRLRPPSLNNEYDGRVQCHLLRKAGITAGDLKPGAGPGKPSLILSDDDLAKIHPCFGFGSFPRRRELAERTNDVDFSEGRPFDITFHGTIDYAGIGEVDRHRKLCLEAVSKLPMSESGMWHHDWYSYVDRMRRTKVIVSPYGCGEPCHRDYEAWLSGCVLVKPDSSHVDARPDTYQEGRDYQPCRADFADLGDIVRYVSNHWPMYASHRFEARKRALMSCDKTYISGVVADSLDAIFSGSKP